MKNRKRVGIARFSFTGLLTLCCVIALSQQGCSSVNESPDPAAVRAAIAEASEQEQQLIRSTIDDPERGDGVRVKGQSKTNIASAFRPHEGPLLAELGYSPPLGVTVRS